jgi:hypothetical protein
MAILAGATYQYCAAKYLEALEMKNRSLSSSMGALSGSPLRPPINYKDISRAKELLKYRWLQKKPWQDEIKRMLASGLKYETRRAGQQGLPLPDQDLPTAEAQRGRLAGLALSPACPRPPSAWSR